MRVERFFHIRPPVVQRRLLASGAGSMRVPTPASKGGATVRVVGDTDNDIVDVQVALCSRNDAFCRRTGRETAAKHPMQRIDLTSLPNFLQATAFDVVRKVCRTPRAVRLEHPLMSIDYSFATKYFKAKEEATA